MHRVGLVTKLVNDRINVLRINLLRINLLWIQLVITNMPPSYKSASVGY